MISGVGDTHTVIWYLSQDKRLSAAAKDFIDATASTGGQIAISAITFVEIIYLIERSRIPVESLTLLSRELWNLTGVFVEVHLTLEIARTLSSIDSTIVPEMPDRIIAATALYLGVPIISRDTRIKLSGLMTIW